MVACLVIDECGAFLYGGGGVGSLLWGGGCGGVLADGCGGLVL